ncbi:MAG: hypothetical protein KGJ07_00375 [Patescibacteria group bacterium]|nr:hypothetical protein [Patescibacteria group bacterium]MDE2589336.1 hypothetical protein [Patescibacteria group bacterium]
MITDKKTQIPEFLRSYFWDVAFDELEMKTQSHLIIKRVLDRGNLRDIRWLLKMYGKDEIGKVVLETRDLSRPTGNFWGDILNLPKNQIACLQKPYSPIHFGLSS